jgi:uncharacterized membrane protein
MKGKCEVISRAWTLFCFLSALVLVLLAAQPALAQKSTDITLWLRAVRNDYSYVVKPGQDNKFYLEVRNIGTERITDLELSSDVVEGWTIEFDPSEFSFLDPGGLQTVDVNICPPNNQSRGQYAINIIAEGNQIRKVQTFYVRVSTASSWVWVWVALVVVIVVVFYFIFRRFSRQK